MADQPLYEKGTAGMVGAYLHDKLVRKGDQYLKQPPENMRGMQESVKHPTASPKPASDLGAYKNTPTGEQLKGVEK